MPTWTFQHGPKPKTIEQVDAIMARIDERDRYRWCGGEKGPCACLGCVQVCSRSLMYEQTFSREHRGDPERIDLGKIPPKIREEYGVTRAEWEAWKERHPDPHPPAKGPTHVKCVVGEPVRVESTPINFVAGTYDAGLKPGSGGVFHFHHRAPDELPVPGVPDWAVAAARRVQAEMYEGDWSIETIAREIANAFEGKTQPFNGPVRVADASPKAEP